MAITESAEVSTRPAQERDRLGVVSRWLGWLLLPLGALTLLMSLVVAPAEATMGEVYRIFFFHLPANIAAFTLFFVAFVAGIGYLRSRRAGWDIWGASAVEVGVLATVIGTATGSIWARPIWNTWWTWDPRLTTVAILLLTYAGYLMLRGAVDEPEQRARYSAVFAILAFANVPLVYFSTRLLDRTIHPVVFAGENPNAEGDMALTPLMNQTLLIAMLFGLLLFAYLLLRRVRLARRQMAVEQRYLMAGEDGYA